VTLFIVLSVTDSLIACTFQNSKRGLNFPVYAILFDGSFSFFKFERRVVAAQDADGANGMITVTPDDHDENADAELQVEKRFYQGQLMDNDRFGLPLFLQTDEEVTQFLTTLRQVADITLYLLLSSYAPALEGKAIVTRHHKDSWKAGADAVHRVCEKCVEAASLDDTNAADALSTSALNDLASRYD